MQNPIGFGKPNSRTMTKQQQQTHVPYIPPKDNREVDNNHTNRHHHQPKMVSRNLGFRFTLVSYNILSQTLLNEHSYLYSNCNPKDLEWPRRGHRIVSELLDNQADIICLQEVECEHLRTLYRPKLARYGYECLYKKKTGYKIDGCAIFYKRNSFHLLDFKGIEFNRTDVANLLNRDNVGIIAVLKPKHNNSRNNNRHQFNSNLESNNNNHHHHHDFHHQHELQSKQLVVANTHLIFNPRRSDIKLAQLKLFLSELEEISFERYDSTKAERCHHPTILCGDLNSVPESEVDHFIMNKGPSVGLSESELFNNVNPEDISDTKGTTSGSDTKQQQQPETNDTSERIGQLSLEDQDRVISEETNRRLSDSGYLFNTSHPFKFKSVYPNQNRQGQPYVSTFSSCIVDYIFYTPNLRLESYRELLTEEELRNVGPIPNFQFPSDHLTLEAKFVLQ